MEKILSLICTALFLLGIAMNIQYAANNYDIKKNTIHTVILAQDGTSTGDGTTNTWEGKKLADVSCTCPEPSNASGHSLKCRENGEFESCTSTQQGLNGCYSAKITVFPPSASVKLLCDKDVKFDGD